MTSRRPEAPALAYTILLAYTYASLKNTARAMGECHRLRRRIDVHSRSAGVHLDVLGVHPYDNGNITINEQDNVLLPAVWTVTRASGRPRHVLEKVKTVIGNALNGKLTCPPHRG